MLNQECRHGFVHWKARFDMNPKALYLHALDDKMLALSIAHHRQDVATRPTLAVPHQEVSFAGQQGLRFLPGEGPMEPDLLQKGSLSLWNQGHRGRQLPRVRHSETASS